MRGAPTSFPSSLRTPSMELPGGSGVTLLRMKKDHGIQPAKKKGPNQRPNRTRLENQGQEQKGKTCERIIEQARCPDLWMGQSGHLSSEAHLICIENPLDVHPWKISTSIFPSHPSESFLLFGRPERTTAPPDRSDRFHRSGFPGHHRQTFSDRAARSASAVSEPARRSRGGVGLKLRCSQFECQELRMSVP